MTHGPVPDCSPAVGVLIPALIFCLSMCVLQSKDIGVQMHEELVKVTNELYTVSPRSSLTLWCLVSVLLATFSSSLVDL